MHLLKMRHPEKATFSVQIFEHSDPSHLSSERFYDLFLSPRLLSTMIGFWLPSPLNSLAA